VELSSVAGAACQRAGTLGSRTKATSQLVEVSSLGHHALGTSMLAALHPPKVVWVAFGLSLHSGVAV